jgi:two-component SAPR family response regulator
MKEGGSWLEAASEGAKKRILAINVERSTIGVVKPMLEQRSDYRIEAFDDPEVGIWNFKSGKYDLVLLDTRMPGSASGIQVYRELRRIDSGVRIWFLASFDIYAAEFNKLFPGMKVEKFLKKPVSADVLVKEIQEAGL